MSIDLEVRALGAGEVARVHLAEREVAQGLRDLRVPVPEPSSSTAPAARGPGRESFG